VYPSLFSEPITLQIVDSNENYFGAQLFTGSIFGAAILYPDILQSWIIAEVKEPIRLFHKQSERMDPVKVKDNEALRHWTISGS
jgi:hypothetical protein